MSNLNWWSNCSRSTVVDPTWGAAQLSLSQSDFHAVKFVVSSSSQSLPRSRSGFQIDERSEIWSFSVNQPLINSLLHIERFVPVRVPPCGTIFNIRQWFDEYFMPCKTLPSLNRPPACMIHHSMLEPASNGGLQQCKWPKGTETGNRRILEHDIHQLFSSCTVTSQCSALTVHVCRRSGLSTTWTLAPTS